MSTEFDMGWESGRDFQSGKFAELAKEWAKSKERIKELEGVLRFLHRCIVFDSKDYSQHRRDVWLYGVVVGWDQDCKEEFVPRFLDEKDWDVMLRLNEVVKACNL